MSKLNEAKALVDELKRRAAEQSALLKTKQQEADSALQEITTSMQVRESPGNRAQLFKRRLRQKNVPRVFEPVSSHLRSSHSLKFVFYFFSLSLPPWMSER